jgi:hypothetical protein
VLHFIVILAQLATPPQPLATETFPLDSEREAVITLGLDGKPVQAVVRRFDGKPMTCDTYFAAFSQTYTCNGNCGAPLTASATAASNYSRAEACSEARAAACASATCSSGSYQFCTLRWSYSLWNGNTGSCTYTIRLACDLDDDCAIN